MKNILIIGMILFMAISIYALGNNPNANTYFWDSANNTWQKANAILTVGNTGLNVWITSGTLSDVKYCNTNAVIISSMPPVSVTGTVTTVEISTGTYYYVAITSYTGTPSVTANGIGLSWLVNVDGGDAEFNINNGNTMRIIDGQGKGSDFKSLIISPTINITSLSAGATVCAFIDIKR